MHHAFCRRVWSRALTLKQTSILLFVSTVFLSQYTLSSEKEIFYHNFDPIRFDTNRTYELSLILLALDKTRDEYGDYEIRNVPGQMTQARSMEIISQGDYPNYVRTFGYLKSISIDKNLNYIEFPVYLGALSFRTCFLSSKNVESFSKVRTKEDLTPFIFGVGIGWSDGEIMRLNGLKIKEISNNNSLFQMTALGRSIDLFCRGANETYPEYRDNKFILNLAYDKHIGIYYPMPMFLYMNKRDARGAERLLKGLKAAYADGSLMTLWEKYHREAIDFVELDKRHFIRLESPYTEQLDFDYSQYFFRPPPQ